MYFQFSFSLSDPMEPVQFSFSFEVGPVYYKKGFFVIIQTSKNALCMKRGRLLGEKQKAPARDAAGTSTEFGSKTNVLKKARIQVVSSYEWSQ